MSDLNNTILEDVKWLGTLAQLARLKQHLYQYSEVDSAQDLQKIADQLELAHSLILEDITVALKGKRTTSTSAGQYIVYLEAAQKVAKNLNFPPLDRQLAILPNDLAAIYQRFRTYKMRKSLAIETLQCVRETADIFVRSYLAEED